MERGAFSQAHYTGNQVHAILIWWLLFLTIFLHEKIGKSRHILREKSLKFPYLDSTFVELIKTKQGS
jgi:hypothetical protein